MLQQLTKGSTMNHRKRRVGRTLMAILMISALGMVVHGHTRLEKSEPADKSTLSSPVSRLQLSFNEDIDETVSKVALMGPSGTVALGPVKATGKVLMADVTGRTSDGTYRVAWQTAGADGHVIKGEFSFNVQLKQ